MVLSSAISLSSRAFISERILLWFLLFVLLPILCIIRVGFWIRIMALEGSIIVVVKVMQPFRPSTDHDNRKDPCYVFDTVLKHRVIASDIEHDALFKLIT